MPKARGLPPDVKPADPPGTLRVSAREMRDAAARAGGFDHLTIGDVQAVVNRKDGNDDAPPKRSKYRNVRTVIGNEVFDSKKEAQHWHELKMRERAGEIRDLRRQVAFSLECLPHNYVCVSDGECAVPTRAQVSSYVADFVFTDAQGVLHVQDVKGGRATQTQLYKLKKKWLELQSGIVIEEI